MSASVTSDDRGPVAPFDPETSDDPLWARIADRVVDRRLAWRRRAADNSVAPVLTVAFEPPLSADALYRLEEDQARVDPASMAGSVVVEAACLRPEDVELTLASIPSAQVSLEIVRRHARVGMSTSLAVSFVADLARMMAGSVHGALHPRRIAVLADGGLVLAGTRVQGLSCILAPPLTREERDIWMAPEVRRGIAVEARSDVFSLGLLLFWLLTDDPTIPSLVRRAKTATREATIPEPLAEVIVRAVSDDPALRHEDVLAFSSAVASHEPPAEDRAVIADVLGYIIDAGRGGIEALLGAVETEATPDAVLFSPLTHDEEWSQWPASDAVGPLLVRESSLEEGSVERVVPLRVASGPRVIEERSNVERIEPSPVVERALPLPVSVPPLAPPNVSLAPARPALPPIDYAREPEVAWRPSSLPPPPVSTPKRGPRWIVLALAAVAVAATFGWSRVSTDAPTPTANAAPVVVFEDAAPTPPGEERPAVETGRLVSIMSSPLGASVWIDGEHAGETPLVMRRALEPRDYAIELELDGYRRWKKRVRPSESLGTINVVAPLTARE